MKGIFLEMQQIYENRPEGYLLKFNSLLYDLLYELLQSCSEKLGERQISQNNRVAMRVFKEKYGRTPKEKRQEKSRNRPINE